MFRPSRRRWPRLAGWAALLGAAALSAGVVPLRADPPAPGAPPPRGPWLSLVIVHTNDIHGGLLPRSPELAGVQAKGDVGGVAALASFVAKERAAARAGGASFLLLDAGDVWRGTPEGDLTREAGHLLSGIKPSRGDFGADIELTEHTCTPGLVKEHELSRHE